MQLVEESKPDLWKLGETQEKVTVSEPTLLAFKELIKSTSVPAWEGIVAFVLVREDCHLQQVLKTVTFFH